MHAVIAQKAGARVRLHSSLTWIHGHVHCALPANPPLCFDVIDPFNKQACPTFSPNHLLSFRVRFMQAVRVSSPTLEQILNTRLDRDWGSQSKVSFSQCQDY